MTADHLNAFYAHDYDTIIDVRSPAEFAEDHIPGAINLPVLDDAERARVGTIYKQVSSFTARKIGAALVFRNAADHIDKALAHHDGGWRPLVYCWRGGQRSSAFTWMLREIGWRADVVQGGYRSYRRLVSEAFYDKALPYKFIRLGGYTGTAKTALLPLLAARGVQTIDLEGVARHRGSLLGEMPGGQPAQRGFESELARDLLRLDPSRLVLVEAESSKIGQINLPPRLWEAMKIAPMIEIQAPIDARADYLSQAYASILADGPGLRAKLGPLRFHRGHALVDSWEGLIDAGDKRALCKSLAQDHYDPAYRTWMKGTAPQILHREVTETLDAAGLEALADRLAMRIQRIRI